MGDYPPLHADLDGVDTAFRKKKTEFDWLPVLGWYLADQAWQNAACPVVESIRAQLVKRSTVADWGPDEFSQHVALIACKAAAEEMGWPNSYFQPDDPSNLVFWAHEDGLDFEFAVIRMADELNIEISMEDAYAWLPGTLGEFVAQLTSKCER